jgi:hypothetical protein
MRTLVVAVLALSSLPFSRWQQDDKSADPLHRPFDQILDIQVRDGLVYYRALRGERAKLDRYAASLDVPAKTYEQQLAFWLNAYNAFVLQTVVDRYPISGKAAGYPASSIRQIPGAFEKLPHRAAGRTVTLDDIEKTILPTFKDPRVYLALGRGAVGSGRLRSEAFTSARLTAQLDAVQSEFVTQRRMLTVDDHRDADRRLARSGVRQRLRQGSHRHVCGAVAHRARDRRLRHAPSSSPRARIRE